MRPPPSPPAGGDAPSKTQVKKALLELQDFGLALLDLPDATLDGLAMPGRLRDALHELRRMHAHGARKRQAQYVGKLLRDADLAPLRRALAAQREGRVLESRVLRQIETWRERLLAGDAALADWATAHPRSDLARLRALVRSARREQAVVPDARGGPGGRGRAYRELFQALRAVLHSDRRTPPD